MKLEQGKIYKIINSFLYCYSTMNGHSHYSKKRYLNEGELFVFLKLENENYLKLLCNGKIIYFPFMTDEDFPDWFEELNDNSK